MIAIRQDHKLNDVPLVRLESEYLRMDIAPGIGGRAVSLVEKAGGHEFLWRNHALPLQLLPSGSEYDPNFFGGIDELLPNDIPEEINGVACPDHGELWTLPLDWRSDGDRLILVGTLPRFGLTYERAVALRPDGPFLEFHYRIFNPNQEKRQFLWKLHAALAIEAGDLIDCPARCAQVVDLNYSRFTTASAFAWPRLEGKSANLIPPADGTVDFFYLYDLSEGRMTWRRPHARLEFEYRYDPKVFPYAWMFASYGGFFGHYTVVLEPCTTMPVSVIEAAAKHQCTVLGPGEILETQVTIRACRKQV